MYPGFLRSMSSIKSNKESKALPQKQLTQGWSSSDNEFLVLTDMLFHFRESLRKFSYLCLHLPACEKNHSSLKDLHESLKEVLSMIKKIVDKYPSIASPEMFVTVNGLVKYIQSCQMSEFNPNEADRLINRLAIFFSKSVSAFIFSKRNAIEFENNSSKKLNTKLSDQLHAIFGVELEKHLTHYKGKVPFVVTKCIKEIEENGIHIKGIYRVSAVKSKVNQLCDDFEKFSTSTVLTNVNPNIVASVLKLYLRQLPQPLFTFDLYPEFIRIAKIYSADLDAETSKNCSQELSKVIAKLPTSYYATASAVMHHLRRISNESEVNNMSAYNLAVIFGPTLLHCMRNNDGITPRSALYDNTHQIRAIQLMILLADILF